MSFKCTSNLATRGFSLLNRGFELVARGLERVTRVLLFHMNPMKNFPCQPVSLEEVEKVIKSLDIKKSALSESIKASILKVHSNT